MKYTYSLLFSLLCAATLFGAAQEETFDEVKDRFITAAQNQNLVEALAIHKTLRELDLTNLQTNACRVAEESSDFLTLIANNLPKTFQEKKEIAICFRSRSILRIIRNNDKAAFEKLIEEKKQPNATAHIDPIAASSSNTTASTSNQNNNNNGAAIGADTPTTLPQTEHKEDAELAAAIALSLEPQPTQGNQEQQITQPSFWSNRLLIVGITTVAIIGIAAAICWFKKK